jgi:hypothetical protein
VVVLKNVATAMELEHDNWTNKAIHPSTRSGVFMMVAFLARAG